jgi:fibronectin type 3 domain-containing protein
MDTDLIKQGVFVKMRSTPLLQIIGLFSLLLATRGIDAQTITSTPQQSTTGVFQFVASSIDVVGLEDEVSYIVRNELRKSPNLDVINQRELEISLARNDIEQRFSAAEAVKAATVLNLNYVIIGKVSRQSQQIVANIQVISPINEGAIGELTFRFSNQAQISLQSDQIGRELAEVISKHQIDSTDMAAAMAQDWVGEISASYDSGEVALIWSLSDPSISVLGYNVYRATDQAGPFSYLSSETETQLVDSVGSLTGTFYYQVSLIDDEGQELRSNQVASVNVFAEQKSSLQAPSIVNTIERVNSAEFEFFPAAGNVGKNIIAYELLRKAPGQAAKVVGTLTLPKQQGGNSNSSKNKPSIQKMKISDTSGEGFSGEVEYAIRAVNAEENGQLTEYLPFTAALAPNLIAASPEVLRQISLSWQASSAGFGYRLYRKTPNEPDWQLLKDIPSLSTVSFTDQQIDGDGKEYVYSISVYDDLGETSLSAPLQVTTKGGLLPPSNVQGVSELARKARITWTRNEDPDVTGYSVFRSEYTPDQEFTLTRIGEIKDPLATSFEDLTGLKDDTQYYYSVASLNRFDSSGEVSKPVLIKTKTPPPPLEQVSASIQNNDMLISWSIPSTANLQDIDKVLIQRKWQGLGSADFETIAEVPPAQSQYTDNTLVAGARAQYRLSLVDKTSLNSKPSSTQAVLMDVPLSLSIAQQGMLRKIGLSWSNAQAPAQIKIFSAKVGEPFALSNKLTDQNDTRFTIEDGLVDDQEYQVKIETWFGNQKLAESNVVNARTKDIPAPINLLAQNNQPRKITLSWDRVNDDSIARYVIFRKSFEDTDSELTAIATTENANQTQYIDEVSSDTAAIKHGGTYVYAVASQNVFDATGFIGDTIDASSKPLPQAPSNITSTATESAIELQWQLGNESDLMASSQ